MTAVPLKVFEEHSGSLIEWYREGFSGKTVVCLDAHLDLQYIDESRLDRLDAAGTLEEVRALEKQDHLLPDGDAVFGLENWLFAAKRLGIASRLVWVAPPHVDIGYSERVLEHVQQMDGVTVDEILSLRPSPSGYYSGRLLGLDIVVCNLDHLATLDIPPASLIDIDTDYFIELPADRPWITPEKVHEALVNAVPDPAMITIARSASSGFMPMRYAFIADHMEALFMQDVERIAHFAKLFLWSTQGTDREALDLELQRFPDCGVSHYLKSRDTHDAKLKARHDEKAIRLSAPYASDPVRKLCGRLNRRLPVSETLLREVAQIAAAGGAAAQRAFMALGLALAQLGRAGEAYICLRKLDEPHPALATAIADRIQDPRAAALKGELFRLGITEDASATWSYVALAELAQRTGDSDTAREYLGEAHSRCPAWLMPLERLAHLSPHGDRPESCDYRLAAEEQRRLLQGALARGN